MAYHSSGVDARGYWFVAQWEAAAGSVLSGRSVWLSAGGGLTLFVAVGQVV
jgi:hypothetical protein